MKLRTSHLLVAVLTSITGVSIAASANIIPSLRPAHKKSVIDQSSKPRVKSISAWQVLLSFENQDLSQLDQKPRLELQKAIDTLVGKGENELLVPRLISKITNAQGHISYALVEESPLIVVPGESRIRIHLFTPEGMFLSSSAFSCGWRIALVEMNLTYVPEIGREALVVSSKPDINGRDIAKQYYALIGEKLLLVRLEDSSGKLIRNIYGAPNHTIGPTLTGRPAKEWVKAFESIDVAEVLAALSWLGGIHWDPRTPAPEYKHEELDEARLVDDVRSHEGVKLALERLVQSGNEWVRSAAELTAKVEYYR